MIAFDHNAKCLLTVLAVLVMALSPVLALDSPSTATPTSWRELPAPVGLAPNEGAIYYSLKLPNGASAHLVVVDYKSGKWRIQPSTQAETGPTSSFARREKASAAINGGFFNLSDGLSTSYIVVDGKPLADPRANQALTENPKLSRYLETILNRSELRVLEDAAGRQAIGIARHNDPVEAGWKLVHSLQGGPRLLPQVTAAEEAFVRQEPDGKQTDSIGGGRPAARTAVGITPDGYVMLVAVAGSNQDPESSGLTLSALAELLRSLGCSEAINFDGGSSTTMFIRPGADGAAGEGRVVTGKDPETRVKSVLILKPRAAQEPGSERARRP